MRRLMRWLRLRATAPPVWLRAAEDEGFAAYACGAAERDCPYADAERLAAWRRGYRRADCLDAAAW